MFARLYNALVAAGFNGIGNGFYYPIFALLNFLFRLLFGASPALWADAVQASNLAGTYANGTAGVGATLTKSSAGALGTIDGVTPYLGMFVLLVGQTTGAQNGLYTVTNLGSSSVAWVLTRWSGWDASAEMLNGSAFYVRKGTTYGGTTWCNATTSAPTVGTTALRIVQDGVARKGIGVPCSVIADVGDAAALPVGFSYFMPITTAAAETNTLAIPTFVGQRIRLMMYARVGGDRVITVAQAINQTGNTIMTFGAARDFIELEGVQIVGDALRWQVVANDGVALS